MRGCATNRAKLAAAILVCLCFGSIHAYGVLLPAVEHWLGVTRTAASAVYALAILSLTAGVYVNGRIEARVSPRLRFALCGIAAFLGLMFASLAESSATTLLGFGIIYGLSNGIGYAASLGLAAEAMPKRPAVAMGLATAAYGLGAALFAQVFALFLEAGAMPSLMMGLGILVFAVCLSGAVLAGNREPIAAGVREMKQAPSNGLLLLGICYFLGAFPGLMVLAHAPSVAAWTGAAQGRAGLVSGLVACGSVAGGYLGSILADRTRGRWGLALPVLVQCAALSTLAFVGNLPMVLALFGLAGLCYGCLISAVPVEVRKLARADGFARAYGKVFTAWGLAGVAGPVTAGYLYDITSGYGLALGSAALLSLASFLLIIGVPQ